MPLARHDFWCCKAFCASLIISTHMPLARHDNGEDQAAEINRNFYSHASCEAWRWDLLSSAWEEHFYSHASCEAWRIIQSLIRWVLNFYSHASCEAWLSRLSHTLRKEHFYSHASCEAWLGSQSRKAVSGWFLLTCLLRGMTFLCTVIIPPCLISTHMPLARHDLLQQELLLFRSHFYSHASCEAWRVVFLSLAICLNFYSHASCEAWPKSSQFTIMR